ASLAVAAWIFSGISVGGSAGTLILAALVYGLLATFVKPVLKLATFPLAIVTLGVAWFFVAMFILWLTDAIVGGLRIDGFWTLVGVNKVVNGDPALDRGLSEQGIEEAERLGDQLAALPLELVAVSPFPRALQTANIALGSREVPHLVDDDLGDVRIGELEGESLDAYRAAPAHTNRKVRIPGGEGLDGAALRYASALERRLVRAEP